jgi:hypothetical protein
MRDVYNALYALCSSHQQTGLEGFDVRSFVFTRGLLVSKCALDFPWRLPDAALSIVDSTHLVRVEQGVKGQVRKTELDYSFFTL